MAEHTPGPYLIVGGGSQLTAVVKADGSNLARLHPDWLASRDPGEVLANALLFKAAPDLLRALEDVIRIAKEKWGSHNEFPAAEAVIAKARGKADG